VTAAKWFGIIVDGTTDIAKREQASLSIRYVYRLQKGDVELREDFIEFVEVEDTTGRSLAHVILNRIIAWDQDSKLIRAQGYDKGPNMSGRFNGVQAVIREKVPEATYTVCMAHGLNTAIVHSCKDRAIANMIDTTKEIVKCVASSAKRHNVFIKNLKEHQKSSREVDDDSNSVCPDRSTSIPLACDTHWLSHVK
jgi:hypothetical protein